MYRIIGDYMKKEVSNYLINNEKHNNILKILYAYPDGLSLREIAYALLGEKITVERKDNPYLSEATVNNIRIKLEEDKEKDYLITGEIPSDEKRIWECLKSLEKKGFINQEEGGKKYTLNLHVRNALDKLLPTMKNINVLEKYAESIELMEANSHIIHARKFIDIYLSEKIAKEYKNSEEIQKKIRKISKEWEELLIDLGGLFKDVREAIVKDDCESWLNLEPHIAVVMHLPPINIEKLLFEKIK